tara:strand:- start:36 stop:914 length:879 start_codon:yes stop_codon:yes gene_type:complete
MAKKTRVAFKMRSSNSTPFKHMGGSPVKGKLDDLIKNFGAELKDNKKDIGGEVKKKYSGKAQRANEVPRPGESKYQFDVRTRKAKNKKAKSSEYTASEKATFDQISNIPDRFPEEDEVMHGSINTSKTKRYNADIHDYEDYTPPAAENKNKTKFSASGTEARKKEYDAKGWKYDDTIKGYNRDGTEKKKKRKFRVQLMVGKSNKLKRFKEINDEIFKMPGSIEKTPQGTEIPSKSTLYTYHSPDFETQEEANTYLSKAKGAGFENAYIPSPIDKKSPTKKKGFKMPGYGKRK